MSRIQMAIMNAIPTVNTTPTHGCSTRADGPPPSSAVSQKSAG